MIKKVEDYKNSYIMYNELLLNAVVNTLKITSEVQTCMDKLDFNTDKEKEVLDKLDINFVAINNKIKKVP